MEDRAEQRTFRVLHDKIQKAANNGILLQDGAADHTKSLEGDGCDKKIPKNILQLAGMDRKCFEWNKCPNPQKKTALNRLAVSVLI